MEACVPLGHWQNTIVKTFFFFTGQIGGIYQKSWSDKLQDCLLNDSCPNFVKADIERAKLGDNNVKHFDEENVDDDDDDGEQPEWVDLV